MKYDKNYLALLFLFCFSSFLNADTYYVSTDGNNSNNGSEGSPWATIQKGASTAQAGDTALVKGGTYNEQVSVENSGSAGNYIVLMAVPGETVTVDGDGESVAAFGEGVIQTNNQDYIVIHGFRVINSSGAGIFTRYSDHIIFRKNYTYNTGSSGIAVWTSTNAVVDSNEVEYANTLGGGSQENMSIAQTDTFEVAYNHVHHSAGQEGIDIKDGSSNGSAHHNECNNIYKMGLYVDAWDALTANIHIYQNLIYENGGDGIDLASEKGGLVQNIWIYNNIIYGNTTTGIKFGDWGESGYDRPMQEVYVINNTVYDNGGYGISVGNPDVISDIVIRNNICSQNDGGQLHAVSVPSGALTMEYNLVDGYSPENGDNHVSGDPQFTNAAQADFSLLNGSPAIDAGSATDAPNFDYTGNGRPAGSGIDIGAYEYGATGRVLRFSNESIQKLLNLQVNQTGNSFRIYYTNLQPSNISLRIYNPAGRLVRTLVNGAQPAGQHTARWDPSELTSSGVYFFRLTTGHESIVKKNVLIP